MACERIDADGGVFAIACTRGARRRRCKFCSRWGVKLCDYPVRRNGRQTTCDAACCAEHAFSRGENLDYCLQHHNLVEQGRLPEQGSLGSTDQPINRSKDQRTRRGNS